MNSVALRHGALACSLLVLLGACANKDAEPAAANAPAGAAANSPPPPDVDVVVIAEAPATLTQDLPGRLQAVRSAQVRARVEGVIEAQLFADGSTLKAGTPLFRIDARTYTANKLAADAELANARATLERYKPLQTDNIVSTQEVEAQRARVATAEAALAKARLDLENAVPPAPISGRAGRALVTEGALVGRGEATHLLTIEQIDPIRVEFTQSQSDLLALKKLLQAGAQRAESAPVALLLEDDSVYAHPGKVKFTDLAVDPATGAIVLRAEFPNPQHELLPGSFVRVRYSQALLDRAVRVPQRAVQTNSTGRSVLVVDGDGKAVPRSIEVGAMTGADFIVEKGLAAGDRVIVNGLQKAKPGMQVNPVPWQAGSAVIAASSENLAKPATGPSAKPAASPARK